MNIKPHPFYGWRFPRKGEVCYFIADAERGEIFPFEEGHETVNEKENARGRCHFIMPWIEDERQRHEDGFGCPSCFAKNLEEHADNCTIQWCYLAHNGFKTLQAYKAHTNYERRNGCLVEHDENCPCNKPAEKHETAIGGPPAGGTHVAIGKDACNYEGYTVVGVDTSPSPVKSNHVNIQVSKESMDKFYEGMKKFSDDIKELNKKVKKATISLGNLSKKVDPYREHNKMWAHQLGAKDPALPDYASCYTENAEGRLGCVAGIGISAPKPIVQCDDMSGDDVAPTLSPSEIAEWRKKNGK